MVGYVQPHHGKGVRVIFYSEIHNHKYLQLNDYNCLAVLTSLCYNENGLPFEYSEARNRPDIFVFNSVMTKSLQPADRTDPS